MEAAWLGGTGGAAGGVAGGPHGLEVHTCVLWAGLRIEAGLYLNLSSEGWKTTSF